MDSSNLRIALLRVGGFFFLSPSPLQPRPYLKMVKTCATRSEVIEVQIQWSDHLVIAKRRRIWSLCVVFLHPEHERTVT